MWLAVPLFSIEVGQEQSVINYIYKVVEFKMRKQNTEISSLRDLKDHLVNVFICNEENYPGESGSIV